MTLDEVIEHAEWCAGEAWGECAEEHKQLADWLRELKQARMKIDLLKILRDGFKADAQMYKDENEKLRELILDMLVDEERGHNDDDTYYEHVRFAKELGIKVDG